MKIRGAADLESDHDDTPLTRRGLAGFLIPSIFGILFFLTPIRIDGNTTIVLGVLADAFRSVIGEGIQGLIVGIAAVSAICTLWFRLAGGAGIRRLPLMVHLFDSSWPWAAFRTIGALGVAMTLTQTGPDWVISDATGGVVLNDLGEAILAILMFAAILLPFLTDYGLMEFIGSLLARPFHFLFRLPGRSAIDATASWLAAATVGVMITAQQYRNGFYTAREAAVIATNFSVVSLPFALVMARFIGLEHLFMTLYGVMIVIAIVQALIIPRLPPLSSINDDYHDLATEIPRRPGRRGANVLIHALREAVWRAERAPRLRETVRTSLVNVADIWFAIIPATLGIALVVMVIAEYTALPGIIAWPLVPVLELLGLPEPVTAAPTFIVGFGDQFLPVIIGRAVESELTRFVIMILAVNQLIFISEMGVMILRSPIPLSVWNLLVIFLLRTAVALPLAAAIGHGFVDLGILDR